MSGGRSLWLAVLVSIYGAAGYRDRALDVIRQLEELSKTSHVSAYEFGLPYFGLGDIDRTLDYFEKAAEQRESPELYLAADPNTVPLTGQPRAKAIFRNLQLA